MSNQIKHEIKSQDDKMEFLLKNQDQIDHNSKRTNKQLEIMKKRRFNFSVCQKFIFTLTTIIMSMMIILFVFFH